MLTTLVSIIALALSVTATLVGQATFAHVPPTGNVYRVLPSGREYLLHIPSGYDHGVEHPLVLSFHGAGGNSNRQERITQLSHPELRIADLPFLVAYPQGVNNTDWNMTHIWQAAPYGNKTVDDIQFVKDIINDVASNYTIDPTRRYANGKSNGGGFTALLACRPDTSLLFAAFAPVAPALYQEAYSFHGCSPSRPVPILHSHGYEDAITPFHGRTVEEHWPYGPEPDVRVWRSHWAERNGAFSTALTKDKLIKPDQTTFPHTNVTEEIWKGRAEVRALSIENLGHAWPTIEGLDHTGSPLEYATFNFTSQHLVGFYTDNPLPKEYLP